MEASRSRPRFEEPLELPTGVRAVVERLSAAGHRAVLVGGCVRDWLRGAAVEDYDVATSATPDEVLALMPRAIPIGRRHGTVMVPTPDGPVDVTRFRAGPDLESDLAHRDFSVNSIVFDPERSTYIDPHRGRDDLREGRLRCVGDPADRLREDPLRALRAARLAACLGLRPEPDLVKALPGARGALAGVARERIRAEVERLFAAADPTPGLELLRDTGLESELAPGTGDDAVAVVAALPPDLELRLAAWLRGTRAARILARMRFPRRVTNRVAHLLRHHPIGAGVNPKRDAAVRRLIKVLQPENVDRLVALRRAELALRGAAADADRAHLAGIETAVARVSRAGELALRRFDLALDGRRVMEILGCGPGREVGRALRFLTDAVIENPDANTPETLTALLERYAEESAPPRS